MSSENLPPVETSSDPTEISRRTLLKMLTAAGAGASAAVLLSGQWVKPVAAGGKLAPHAQTSQTITHRFVSSQAQQIVNEETFISTLRASCVITPSDPNIPIVASVYANISAPTLAPAAQTLLATLNANTDVTGTATFADTELTEINCQTVPQGSTGVVVVFAFAHDPADGTDHRSSSLMWTFGC